MTVPQQKQSGRWSTHHFEVLGAALDSSVVAGQQHVLDVVSRSIVELAHVEGPRFEGQEVSLDLQGLQNALLHQVSVPDLIPEKATLLLLSLQLQLKTSQLLIRFDSAGGEHGLHTAQTCCS